MVEEWYIDGCNLLHELESSKSEHRLSQTSLLQALVSFASPGKRNVWMVLDGHGNSDEFQATRTSSFQVVYSQNVSADSYIERAIAEKKGQALLSVVTRDGAIRQMARGVGARVMNGQELLQRLKQMDKDNQDLLSEHKADSLRFNRPFDKKL